MAEHILGLHKVLDFMSGTKTYRNRQDYHLVGLTNMRLKLFSYFHPISIQSNTEGISGFATSTPFLSLSLFSIVQQIPVLEMKAFTSHRLWQRKRLTVTGRKRRGVSLPRPASLIGDNLSTEKRLNFKHFIAAMKRDTSHLARAYSRGILPTRLDILARAKSVSLDRRLWALILPDSFHQWSGNTPRQ